MPEKGMTEEQKEFLCTISVDEGRVREGKLYSWQQEILDQYDYAMDCLYQKYPSYQFRILFCEPKNKLNAYTAFTIVEEADPEEYYSLYVYVEETDSGKEYEAKDNFYGYLKEDAFARKLLDVVVQEYPKCVAAETNMPYVQGMECGEEMNIEQLISGDLQIGQDTTFILDGSGMTREECAEYAAELEAFVKERGIFGSYCAEFSKKGNREQVLYKTYFFGS